MAGVTAQLSGFWNAGNTTGCTVNFKTYTNSIWDKKQRENPIEKRAIFPNTHERHY